MEAKRTSRNQSPTRNVKRMKSKSQKDSLSRSRSNDRRPSREESKLRALSRSRSGNQKDLNRSQSNGRRPSREESKLRALSRSRGRSGSPARRTPNRSRSSDQLRGNRKAPDRSRSFGLERDRKKPPQRTRSFGLERSLVQDLKGRRARSASPSLRVGGRSRSSSRVSFRGIRGRSSDPASRNRARSRSRSADRFSDEVIRKEYPSQRPEDNGISRRRLQSFRKLKEIGGRGKELSWSKLCQYLIPLAIILGASVGLMYATGNGSIITDKINDIINTLENSEIIDPFVGEKAPHWPRTGNGLKITIINALTDDWQVTFDLATVDWMTGEPHAVEINGIAGTYDKDCDAPDDTVIVCNGDYGDKKWRGVNEAMTIGNSNVMVSSSARMNEYYLKNMEKGAWQYTMCHELGHALGLAHTDEDFDNKDLGNCMDYTNNLDANKHPDSSNYETLLDLYGPISGGERLRVRQLERDDIRSQSQRTKNNSHLRTAADASFSTVSSSSGLPQISAQRLRKRDPLKKDSSLNNIDTTQEDVGIASHTVPDHIRKKKKEAVKKLYQRVEETYNGDDRHNTPVGHTHDDGWTLVHRKHLGEEHETDLGEGYKVRVQFLLIH